MVAELLNKLLIEFTKSRPRKTNDQALVEGKNGSVVRKQMGYAHIPQSEAQKTSASTARRSTSTSTSIAPAALPRR